PTLTPRLQPSRSTRFAGSAASTSPSPTSFWWRRYVFAMEDRPLREELLERARSALRGGDAAGARLLLDEVYAECSDDADVLEVLGRAAYLELDFQGAIEHWQRAYAGFRASGDQYGAVRVARLLAPAYGMVLGDGAVMSGWIARAQTLLGERV